MCYKRKQEEKRRLKRLFEETKNHCSGGVYYSDHKGRLVRYSLSDRGRHEKSKTKYWKNRSNRKIRKLHDVFNHGEYKKLYDYWWILF